MAWCPKCKEEYEDHAQICVDCKVPLVATKEEIPTTKDLLRISSEEEARKVVEFLNYSKINGTSIREELSELGDESFVVEVEEEEWQKAALFIQGYLAEEKEEVNKEDYYFNEYETLDVSGEHELTELKTSISTFFGLGVVFIGLGALNLLKILQIFEGTINIVLLVTGVLLIVVGITTKSKVASKKSEYALRKEEYQNLYQWYVENYSPSELLKRNQIDLSHLDEGVKYFTVMDAIIKELAANPHTQEEKMMNTVADRVYNEGLYQ